jgi:hypothetical protein
MRNAPQALGLVALALAVVSPASAAAQSGDPAQDSPSGVIYEIPLDDARQDAAPGRGSGGGASAGSEGAQGGTVSSIHSENGFGSSSTVPGAATGAVAKGTSGGKRDKGRGGKRAKSGSGAGETSTQPTGRTPAAAAESLGAPRSAAVAPSKSRAYLLLLLALAVAAGLGVAGRYMARRR